MTENRLFASVVLFKDLYDNNRDIYDVIAEFLKAAIILKKKWTFNSIEANQLLEELYDFKLPEAVVKSVLRNRLGKSGIINLVEHGCYSMNWNEENDLLNIELELEKQKQIQQNIIQNLICYIEENIERNLSKTDKEEIVKNFNEYLLDNGYNEKYSNLISSYIIENGSSIEFNNSLNSIKEGLIIYDGIRYYPTELNNLGSWNSNLTIYLDTEHLFNALGYNGQLYEDIFNDFFNLVQETNRYSKSKSPSKKIQLKFFQENKQEIDKFFYVAELIIDNKTALDPSKTAMISILQGCSTRSDIVAKKAKFYRDLENKGLVSDNAIDIASFPEYNVLDSEVLKQLRKKSEENNKEFDEVEVEHFLNIYSKINILRRGKSSSFENIGYIFMSGKSVSHFLAHNTNVKFKEKDIPFATDIEFITNKLWFKLKKGLSNNTNVPKSFDIATKAKIILSSQINSSIGEKYSLYAEKYKKGEITKEEIREVNNELRERTSKPEEVISETLDNTLVFLNSTDLSDHLREKSLLIKKANEGELAIKELKSRDFKILKAAKNAKKKRVRQIYFTEYIIIIAAISTLICLLIFSINTLRVKEDTLLSIIGLLISVISLILTALYRSKAIKKLRKRAFIRYLDYLRKVDMYGS
jgi:hypothetical protein